MRDQEGNVQLDMTPDASIYGAIVLGACDCDEAETISTAESLHEKLSVDTKVGGMARYVGDEYQRVAEDRDHVPGNPWFIATLWYAQYLILRAESVEDLTNGARTMIEWVASHALPSGVLAEQVNPYTDAPLSVSPLTWSHASVVITVADYVKKMRELSHT